MRQGDTLRLSAPYTAPLAPEDSRIEQALEVHIPEWDGLVNAIVGDLLLRGAEPGSGWWAPYPGTRRRILISDQLYACAHRLTENLIEARLHWLEFLDALDRENARMVNSVEIVNGRPIIRPPRPLNAVEELPTRLARLHGPGAVRALSGALDCLSGTIIGVIALPSSIIQADFRAVRAMLAKVAAKERRAAGEEQQAIFGQTLEDLIGRAGPPVG